MSSLSYGIRKLILINTASYSVGVFPLDKPLSIYGANNRGKSTAINALQFIFSPNIKHMVFPKSMDKTREFYFPYDSSYV